MPEAATFPWEALVPLGDYLYVIDKLDPEKRLGYWEAVDWAANLRHNILMHNRENPDQRIEGDFWKQPAEYFEERGFFYHRVIQACIDTL